MKSKATILISALLLWANGYPQPKSTLVSAALPKALEREDAVWLGQHTADKLVFIDVDGSALNKAAYLSKRGANPDRILSGENKVDGIYIQGDLAFAHGNSHLNVMYEGKEHFLSFRWTSTYVKQDGRWRVIAGQVTRINANWKVISSLGDTRPAKRAAERRMSRSLDR